MPLDSLNTGNSDGVVSALTGNGRLCTTLSPTGFHCPPGSRSQVADRTQLFVIAGRRLRSPQHEYLDFGSLVRRIWIDGVLSEPLSFSQTIDPMHGLVLSSLLHTSVAEETTSFVTHSENAFIAQVSLTNTKDVRTQVRFRVTYSLGEPTMAATAHQVGSDVAFSWQHGTQMGTVMYSPSAQPFQTQWSDRSASTEWRLELDPGQTVEIGLLVQFIDRLDYAFPHGCEDIARMTSAHRSAWRSYQTASAVRTGNETVDAMRMMALYTLHCQATPWSIPASLSIPYWGGGAFHDELYPLAGLITSGDTQAPTRILRFRLQTLGRALQRANYRGALYPWSSTEFGEERDPDGLWLTERFHLGQFAAAIRMVWRYTRDSSLLRELWPVIDGLARYFEMNLVERDAAGRPQMRPCVDFDESVGAVRNGPFTVSAAICTLEFAAEVGRLLDIVGANDRSDLASVLRGALPTGCLGTTDQAGPGEVFAIPDGKPLHYSIIGPIFPFEIEVATDRAVRSAEHITAVCRSTMGWKSGFSDAFTGSNWMWTAGHLGIVHAINGNSSLAWDAVLHGPDSAGPMLSPNEHRDRHDVVQVPWFTTGIGAWLAALNMLFVRLDDEGAIILGASDAVPGLASFADLPAGSSVRVSGRLDSGRPLHIVATADTDIEWSFRVPRELGHLFGGRQRQDAGRFSRHTVTVGSTGTTLLSCLSDDNQPHPQRKPSNA